MKVLIYYPSSYLSIFILTVVEELIAQQHQVYLLSTSPFGILQQAAAKLGAEVYTSREPEGIKRVFKDVMSLTRFCKKHKIDFVFSHLQYLNLVAALSQPLIKAKVFPMRHHADDVYLGGNKNARILDRLVNIFSTTLLVVSEPAKTQMTVYENVPPDKIIVLPLYYNFKLYHLYGSAADHDIPKRHDIATRSADILTLINVGRMVKNKNHISLLKVVKRLVNNGLVVKLMLLDEGPLEQELQEFVQRNQLSDHVFFLGRKENILDYTRAADLMVHTSLSESSCQVVMEAGLCGVPAVVVADVGIFDSYLYHQHNGFIVSKEGLEDELYTILAALAKDKSGLAAKGAALKQSVMGKFDISSAKITYLNLLQPEKK